MKTIKTESGKEMTPYLASAIAEGFCEGEGASAKDQILAWSYLIKTGLCYQLQGWYGRAANSIISEGLISKTGDIDWDEFESRMSNAE